MQRWQRRAHLWLWLLVGAVVVTALAALIEDQPQLAGPFATAPSP